MGLQMQSGERADRVATRPWMPPTALDHLLSCGPTNPTEAALPAAWRGWIKNIL